MSIKQWTTELCQELRQDYQNFTWNSPRTRLALKSTLATMLAVYIAWSLNIVNPQWAAISGVIVMQGSSGATLTKGLDRLLATFGGVLWAVILTVWLVDQPALLLSASFATILLSAYLVRKTRKPYVWILGPATFCLVVFSESYGAHGVDIANTAYYRTLEITIGTLCAMGVSLLFFPSHAQTNLKTNTQKMVNLLQELFNSCFVLYTQGIKDEEFDKKLKTLHTLIESQVPLRRFIQQERLFNVAKSKQSSDADRIILGMSELLAETYERYQPKLAGLGNLFTESATALQTAVGKTLQALHEFVASDDITSFTDSLAQWQAARDQLLTTYAQLREKDCFAGHELATIAQWQYFIAVQRNLCQMANNFHCQAIHPKLNTPILQQIKNALQYDRFYWLYAIKSAIATIGLTFIGVYLDVPGPAMIAVVVILMMQMDMYASNRWGYFTVISFSLGTLLGLGLVCLNFDSSMWYFIGFAVAIFLQAYLIHGSLTMNYVGMMSAVAFIMGTVIGTGPVTDWSNSLILLSSTIIAVIATTIFISWVWPFSHRQVFAHALSQLRRYRTIILSQLQHEITTSVTHEDVQMRLLLIDELQAFRQNLKLLEILDLPAELKSVNKALHHAWYHYYRILFNITLVQQTLAIPVELNDKLPAKQFAAIILSPTTSTAELLQQLTAIETWQQQLRDRALQGHLLPVKPLLRTIHLLWLFKDLIQQQAEIDELTQRLRQLF
jgi:uncharacterized membrane protein YccC